jgi:hypothetical protein
MRGGVRRIYNGIPAAMKAVPRASEKIIDTLTFKLLRDAKGNIRDVGLIDTGALRNSGYAETTRTQGARLAAQKASSAAGRTVGRNSGQSNPVQSWATPSPAPKEGEGKVAFAVEYAIYWELGFLRFSKNFTGPRMSIRPFLGPAADQLHKDAPDLTQQIFNRIMDEALKEKKK